MRIAQPGVDILGHQDELQFLAHPLAPNPGTLCSKSGYFWLVAQQGVCEVQVDEADMAPGMGERRGCLDCGWLENLGNIALGRV